MFYWSELYSGQLFETDSFDKLNKTISINLLDFRYFPDERYVRRYCLKDYDSNETYPEIDFIDMYYVELRKFDGELRHIKNALDRWITFLNRAGELEKDKLPKELADPEIKKAIETLERINLNKKEREYYEERKKFLRDEYAADKTMEEKIKMEGIIDTAFTLIKKGYSNEIIKDATGLSDDRINDLRSRFFANK